MGTVAGITSLCLFELRGFLCMLRRTEQHLRKIIIYARHHAEHCIFTPQNRVFGYFCGSFECLFSVGSPFFGHFYSLLSALVARFFGLFVGFRISYPCFFGPKCSIGIRLFGAFILFFATVLHAFAAYFVFVSVHYFHLLFHGGFVLCHHYHLRGLLPRRPKRNW